MTSPRPTHGKTRAARVGAVTLLLVALTACSGTRERADWHNGQPAGTDRPGTTATPTGGAQPGATPSAGSAGTGASTSPTPGRPASAATNVRVVLTRAGGIAGRGETITVEPKGSWTVTERAGGRRTGRLSTAERNRLYDLTNDPRLAAEAARAPGGTTCRDVFTYTLSAGPYRVTFTDCPTDTDRPAAALAIVDLLTAATG
ncbi:hypothetical protein [Micromonospora echinofusca]|uniref:DUF5642 domain-containing protein n=1 Tax=Micromonospora echinofusca TaxID=47858 RepID=A0ABS3VR18_MICEH|nr:hypothetical protein [Micromonospora echinofusca]MBO4206984.1 hypothetical protein [Micromonospora echinofusca]